MNKDDLEILRLMRIGKRLSISGIARSLNIPISTVSDKIRRIEEKYVTKRASLINYPRLGFFANSGIAIKAARQKRSGLLEFLKQERCVNSICHINNGFDFLIDCVWRDAIERKEWICSLCSRFNVELQIFNVIKTEEREMFITK